MDTWNEFLSEWEAKYEKPLLYVSGPMVSGGDPYVNVHNAIKAGEYARSLGWAVIVSHLDSIVAMVNGVASPDYYLDNDFNLIDRCDAVLLLPFEVAYKADGSMTGTEKEIAFAEFRGLPVYTEDTLPCAHRFDDMMAEETDREQYPCL